MDDGNIKKKKKKKIEQGIYQIYCNVSMMENQISGNMYDEP